MAHVISDTCIKCGTCEGECPVDAISEETTNFQLMQTVALIAVLA